MSGRIVQVVARRMHLRLVTPYRLSYRIFEAFEPMVVEIRDDAGGLGLGEGHVSPGSSAETREGGWSFVRDAASRLPGNDAATARATVEERWRESPVAGTALVSALEMLQGTELLRVREPTRLPLLAPVNGLTPEAIEGEIEERLAEGFRTFKVKVGKDPRGDLTRLGWIQSAVAERATLRVDANRAYDVNDALAFCAGMDPDGVELFEQPCDAADWDANARVAGASPVPLMLDEPICGLADIERAADVPGVRFLKLKLKRFGGLARLDEALRRVRELGMSPVLGDGLGGEITCWMEGCVARDTIDNAGEFNGYLKPSARLFRQPLGFENGAMVLPAGEPPRLDPEAVERHSVEVASWGR